MIGSAILTGGAGLAVKGAVTAGKAALSAAGKARQAYRAASVADGLITAGKGAYQTYEKGLSWESALMMGGGVLGARMDVGDMAKVAGRVSRVAKGLGAVDKPALAVLKPVGKVAVALLDTKVARGLGKGAFHVVNTPLSVIVHKGLGNIHKGAHDWVSKHLNRMGFRVCFVAGTPIVGPWGSKAIEEYKDYETYGDACDTLISRDEFNDDGILTVRRVLRRFERIGPVLDVVINGQRIGTTHEHPFFVKGKGWTKAQELRVGDQVRLMQPGWATVEAVEDTGRLERVYNLEIEDDHTYFVGCDEWGWAVWSHNAECQIEVLGKKHVVRDIATREVLFEGTWGEATQFIGAGRHTLVGKVAGGHPVLASRLHGSRLDELVENAKPSRQGRNVEEHVYTNPGHHDPHRSPGTTEGYKANRETLPANHVDLFERSVVISKGGRDIRVAREVMDDGFVRYHRFNQHHDNVFHWTGSTRGETASGLSRPITVGRELPSMSELRRLFGS